MKRHLQYLLLMETECSPISLSVRTALKRRSSYMRSVENLYFIKSFRRIIFMEIIA